jgi:hypothetical protein
LPSGRPEPVAESDHDVLPVASRDLDLRPAWPHLRQLQEFSPPAAAEAIFRFFQKRVYISNGG